MPRHTYLKKMPAQQAWETLAGQLAQPALTSMEELEVIQSLGRIVAEPIWARISAPHYHAAAMDGIALLASTTAEASPTSPVTLTEPEGCLTVDTGNPLPENFDAVVMIEDVHERSPGQFELTKAASPGQHIRYAGEDIVKGELLLVSGHAITPYDIAALLTSGNISVAVRAKPRIAILPTGTEIVPPGTTPTPGQVVESNSYMLAAMIEQWGGKPIKAAPVADDRELLRSEAQKALDSADALVVIAGSSAGRRDFTPDLFDDLGTLLVHGINMMPGKPAALGEARGKALIGIPGYPVSAAVAAERFLKPLIERHLGTPIPDREKITAELSRNIPSRLGTEEVMRVVLGKVGGRCIASPLSRGAGMITSLSKASALVKIPPDLEGLRTGTVVEAELLISSEELERTLLISGSHDLTLEVAADLLARKHPGTTIRVAPKGSLGGLTSLTRNEAHLATAHLIDPPTGLFNLPYIERLLPHIPVWIIAMVMREQGIYLAPGNPKGIQSPAHLAREDVTFVNRQRGAGTRLLLDLTLSEQGIDPSAIQGYNREVTTHMAAAVAVAEGATDAALGIRAAATALNLDFLPLAEERYDLIIPEKHYSTKGVKQFMEMVHSAEFKRRVEQLGGYNTEVTGRPIAFWDGEKFQNGSNSS